MLADLAHIGCYNSSAMPTARRRASMIADAKSNLRRLAFFGLTERQIDSGYLFERRFGVRFQQHLRNQFSTNAEPSADNGSAAFNQYNSTRAEDAANRLPEAELNRVRHANKLDIELYDYARRLFNKRLQIARTLDRRRAQQDFD
jgi:hypothetical protein